MGLLLVDMESYGSIRLTSESMDVLQGNASIKLRKDHLERRKRRASGKGRSADRHTTPEMEAIFEALRARRMELSKEMNVPPYVIFHDSTLLAMAEFRPATLDEMMGITGVGERKLAKYGGIFLEALNGFGRE